MIDLRNMDLTALKGWIVEEGYPAFRAKQLYNWITKGVLSFEEMTNLPSKMVTALSEKAYVDNVKIVERHVSSDGTIKYLMALKDRQVIETVLMHYRHGHSICVSTQVGCRMGCTFCASALEGRVRDLTAGEILGQMLTIMHEEQVTLQNVVLMGSGEPLDNFEEVLRFLELVNDPEGLNFSHRRITLSTCGIVPRIYELADRKLQINLAISLHNPFDDERVKVMPIGRMYPLHDLMAACRYYSETTHRRITFEYALINGENDTSRHAHALGKLLKGTLSHVNLIPVNLVREKDFRPAEENTISAFKRTLEEYKLNTTIRRELGSDINAACGQLRKSYLDDLSVVIHD